LRLSWLHLSDLHLRDNLERWDQEVVLRDLLQDIKERIEGDGIVSPSFSVITGDLAFAGKGDEYSLVNEFLDALAESTGLTLDLIFFVPGNHDVDRSVQTTAHLGARQLTKTQEGADLFLADEQERDNLLQRMDAYRTFSTAFPTYELREFSSDGLCFVQDIEVRGILISILGINSAWLADGGEGDRGCLIVGARQALDAARILENRQPVIAIGMMHHPLDWLRDFDEREFELRLLPSLDFLHRGHLHEPRITSYANSDSRQCIVIQAGASYAGRRAANAYSLVTLDVDAATAMVTTFTYDPDAGRFFQHEVEPVFDLQFRGDFAVSLDELAEMIVSVSPVAKPVCYLMSALLLEQTRDIPLLMSNGSPIFLSDTASDIVDPEGEQESRDFLALRNRLRAYARGVPVPARVANDRQRLDQYAAWLLERMRKNKALRLLVEAPA